MWVDAVITASPPIHPSRFDHFMRSSAVVAFQKRNELYNIVYPAGVTAMNLYQFARQFKKPVWEKLDYDKVEQTQITNRGEYNEVCTYARSSRKALIRFYRLVP